jgi:hypothetical protein
VFILDLLKDALIDQEPGQSFRAGVDHPDVIVEVHDERPEFFKFGVYARVGVAVWIV